MLKLLSLIKNIVLILFYIALLGVIISIFTFAETGMFNIIFYIIATAIFCIGYVKLDEKCKKLKTTQVVSNDDNPIATQESESEIKKDDLVEELEPIKEVKTVKEDEPSPLSFPDTYIVLDIETPNRKNNSICQLGLALVERGEIIKDYSTLINPQDEFDYTNINKHNITKNDVIHAPKIYEYWYVIKELFDKYVVVSHNANFDLTVLGKTLYFNDIENIPPIKYVCTLVACQNKFPELDKYTLLSLCEHFNINVENHHNAKYDIQALTKLFETLSQSEKMVFVPQEFIYTPPKNVIKIPKTTTSQNFNDPEKVELEFDTIDDINFESRFVLTGLFDLITKKEITSYIEEKGGRVTSGVSKVTNYLIVGTYRETAWKYGEYGTKIKKALDLRDTTGIKIIKEKDFVDFME